MRALKKTRRLIEKNPGDPTAQLLSELVVALETEAPFKLSGLYQLKFNDFELAIALIAEWRLDRYYTSKAILLDLAVQLDRARADMGR